MGNTKYDILMKTSECIMEVVNIVLILLANLKFSL